MAASGDIFVTGVGASPSHIGPIMPLTPQATNPMFSTMADCGTGEWAEGNLWVSMPNADPLEALAQRLYFMVEKMEPVTEEFCPWDELSESKKHFYRFLISDLSRFGHLWRAIDKFDQ